ncbi:MAG: hypothetical protein AAFQ82_04060, partial [Myxococcota bacterium]
MTHPVRTATWIAAAAVMLTSGVAQAQLTQGALPMDAPELGSRRRVVMSEMRRAGFELLSSENDTLVFRGSPQGWPEATTTTYIFRRLVAEEVRLDFIDMPKAKSSNALYASLKKRMTRWFGAPWLERQPNAVTKSNAALKTTWENEAHYAELRSVHRPL